MLLALACAAPLWGVRLKLKAADKDFDATNISLLEETVSYRIGRRDHTAKLDDFELESQFIIKRHVTEKTPEAELDLARWAMHRELYRQAGDIARKLVPVPALRDDAEAIVDACHILEADQLLDRAVVLLDAQDVAAARPLLEEVVSRFPATPARVKADVLISTLKNIELELKAAALEEEARKAQADADADERKKRAHIDVWLEGLDVQINENTETKKVADEDCTANQITRGMPKYDNVVKAMEKLQKAIDDNRKILTFRGQTETADRIYERARKLIVECLYSWAFHANRTARYDVAANICARGIRMDPKDRRFLSLKVDIDEVYDPRGG